ncbi:MAG: response regulator [Dehalococcoidales bacterium]|nr:response regulator [Dehalococcoidales bacterium]
MKIVIADNDFQSLEDIAMAFNLCIPEIELIITLSSGQCLEMLKGGHADIVILGWGLSDIPCLDVISKIRSHSDIPIIVLYYKKDGDEPAKALKAGANDYMAKPVKQLELIARVKKLIEEHSPEEMDIKGIEK